ncbi:hypothetical protein M2271_007588 [Streptomyces sp. LBL]|uniref:carboxypeptidase regulatory-like domain-containing protein n=1 Tax=Streptomyces sp. LBL TaxID=2940562 RepID=UPI0024756045|nr:carboxypeptidase regulatory-like domain-containing protein [Streptomyces sp. LBL]MDH6629750.1 hypothetical protein [Streptomyces sp. LBL]
MREKKKSVHIPPLRRPDPSGLRLGNRIAAVALSAAIVAMSGAADASADDRTALSTTSSSASSSSGKADGTESLCGTPSPGEATCFAIRRTGPSAKRPGAVAAQAPPGFGPADLRTAYALPGDGGEGLTVAVVVAQDAPTAEADLAVYRAQFGLPACTSADGCFTKVDQRGGTDYPDPEAGWAGEAALDLDMVSAAAPHARLLLVEADDTTIDNLGAAVQQAVTLGADVVSNSYGTRYDLFDEDPAETAWDAYYDHPGVAIVASSGDDDAGVSFPAASPHVTAVGGTSLRRDTGTARGWSESVWSHDGYGAGSGCSRYLPKPAFQHDSGCDHRTVADVSAVADPDTGVAVYDSYGSAGWGVYGGTSASAPLIAGVYAAAGALAEDTEPNAYPYAAPDEALNDVTAGSNGTCDPAYLCTAATGYDGPTGLGTPNGLTAFRMGPHGRISGTVTDARTGRPVPGAAVLADDDHRTSTDTQGHYALTLPTGTYDLTVDAYGYATAALGKVRVDDGTDLARDLPVTPVPSRTVSGTVTDGSGHGWPLYASITVDGTPLDPVWTDPATGRYSVSLPTARTYPLHIAAAYPGYRAVTREVKVTGRAVKADIAVAVDEEAALAPGYAVHRSGPTEPFTETTAAPAGWWVADADSSTGGWTFDDPGARGNTTGGEGAFAVVDSDHYGGGVSQDSQLISPVYDFTDRTAPRVAFDTAYRGYEGQSAAVDVSTDHGTTWTTVWRHTTDSVDGPAHVEIPLSDYAGRATVQLRFHFTGSFGWWWAVDDVFVGDRTYDKVPGGLVVGHTRDANTKEPVNGAEVTGGATGTSPAVSVATPADPATADGLYRLFAPAGDHGRTGTVKLTASKSLYADRTVTARVVPDRVRTTDLALPAGRLTVTPAAVAASVRQDSTARATVTVRNTGGAPASVRIQESADVSATPPQGEEWQPAPDLAYGVIDNAADTYRGTVYTGFGMEGDDTVQDGLWAYDTTAGDTAGWVRRADAPQARRGPVHGFIDGKWYVAGGKDEADQAVTSVAVYDPAADTWSTGAAAPEAYSLAGSAVLNGRLFMVGGCGVSCGVTAVQSYDPATDSWRSLAPYPLPIAYPACGGLDGHVVCAGGQSPGTGVVDDVYSYDPADDTWSPVASLPTGVWGAAYTTAAGRLLLTGGSVGTQDTADITAATWSYDPGADAWQRLPDNTTPTYRGAAAAGLYKIGGSTGWGDSNAVTTTELLPGYGQTEAADIPWLSEETTTLTVPAHSAVTLRLTLDATLPETRTPGRYTAALGLVHDTPYTVPPVPVSMKVTAVRPHS